MVSLKERLLAYYHLSEDEYGRRILPPAFSSLPTIESDPSFKKAESRLALARKNAEKVLVYGDYDTDGIMSCSIILKTLRRWGIDAQGYLPSRYSDGYGLSAENVQKIAKKGFSLIFTVDNGVTAFDAIEEAGKLGVDVIVLDHHEIGDRLPDCAAVLHPVLLHYGEVPVSAGYLAAVFSYALTGEKDDYLFTLGGISTLSDMMPLMSYNREIVRLALENIKRYRYPEILALSEKGTITEQVLSMTIIPKINAIGRMEKGHEINRLLKYFAEEDSSQKQAVAQWLSEVNEERKRQTKEAEAKLTFEPSDEALVVLCDVAEGLNGLLANRLLQEYEKPVAVFSPMEGDSTLLVGSLRSKEGFSVMKALQGQKVELLSGGGHEFAGGVTIRREDFDAFRKEFIFAALKHKLTKKEIPLIPLTLEECTGENYRLIASFGPFGMSWGAPHFLLGHLDPSHFTYASNGKYLSTRLSKDVRLFSFSLNEDSFLETGETALDVVFSLNEYRGRLSIDLLAERP